MSKPGDIIVGLDIGTTKTAVVIGEMNQTNLEVIGYGIRPSDGLRKGMVINIDRTVESILETITEAESKANCEISTIFTGISGSHIQGLNSHGIIAIKGDEVTEQDVHNVYEAAKAIAIPNNREIIHTLPQEFIIDDQDGIKDPLGMAGVRLQAKVHIITGAKSAILNIVKCCNKAGLSVSGIALQQIASAEAILSDEEKDLGTIVIDIGGGTTDISIFHSGNIVHTAVLPIGGNHITNDIAVGLRITTSQAEKIKREFGSASLADNKADEQVEIGPIGSMSTKAIPKELLLNIIVPRIEEIFELTRKEIERTGLADILGAGAILTGGTSLLTNIQKSAEEILDIPVRLGAPKQIELKDPVLRSPSFSTAVGLVLYASKNSPHQLRTKEKGFLGKMVNNLKNWFGHTF